VINRDFRDGKNVLVIIDKQHLILAKHIDNKLIDKADGKEYKITDKTDIIGNVYAKLVILD